MSDFVEWNPKRHGQKPPYWEPGMPTSVDGLNFSHQPNWAWIAGSTYYVPREAVELPRIEPEPEQTDEQRIRAQVFQEIREAVDCAYMGWSLGRMKHENPPIELIRDALAALEKQP
jgi:hypothetical protein